ncbi:MAG: M3 family oligoendopeptidase, partial [Bacteroidota bacterium]
LNETPDDLEAYLRKRNELDAIIAEEFAWRYIHMTRHTDDKEAQESYQNFVQQIMPHLSRYDDKLNRKIASHPAFSALPDRPYLTYKRQLKRHIDLFREENIPLHTEAQSTSQQYGVLTGAMTIEHNGQELTLQQASKYLEHKDGSLRQAIWEKINARRAQDQEALEGVFDKLIGLRHKIAQQAGYQSFTRFKFDQMGRFDYAPADTRAFHDAVEQVITPVYTQLLEERKRRLGLDVLRPWDLSVDIFGDTPLKPFEAAPQLLDRSVSALMRLRPELGEMIRIMDRLGFLDLESRVGKAPGGYNYPLMETGVPFIFMNAAGTQTDVITMLHESGHAVHAFLTRDIPLNALKQTPSEVAELASMTMELLCLDHYDAFYDDPKALARAQKGQLLRCIVIFPWIAAIDAFQQWVYDHPEASRDARKDAWVAIYSRFHGPAVDWSGYEDIRAGLWAKQGHIFDVPFYYIEYAIAQMGALAIWKNYKSDPATAMDAYLEALKLGYTRTIPELYAAAGIRFDFSADYMRECLDFCLKAYQEIEID